MTIATYAAATLLRVLPRTQITRAVGRLCDARLPEPVSRAVVGLYARAYRVNLDEAASTVAPYESFDAFFTRPLRQGARPECGDPDALVSPSDGRISAVGPVGHDGKLVVKGRPYTAAELVGDGADALRYDGGQYAIVYLSPRDYHRVHAPVAGALRVVRSLPGDLYPVNAIGERHVPGLFAINRRVAFAIDTERLGRVTAVMVGAMIVGRITATHVPGHDVPLGTHELAPAPTLARGDEIGIFHMGSTVVLFVEPGVPQLRRAEGPVWLGESLMGAAP
jgi:phosphatidylserine decarboxylase